MDNRILRLFRIKWNGFLRGGASKKETQQSLGLLRTLLRNMTG